MKPWSILKIVGGIIATLLTGAGWKHLHDRQAQHMLEYGDTKRNKYGMWK